MSKPKTVTGKIVDWNVLKRLFQFIRPYKWPFALLIFLTTLSAGLVPLRPYLIQLTIDDDIAKGNYPGMVIMIYWLIGLLILQALIQYLHTYLSGWIGQYIVKDIRVKLYDHLLKLRLKFYDNTPIAGL